MTGALNYVRLYKGLATEAIYPYISAVMLILSYIAELHIYRINTYVYAVEEVEAFTKSMWCRILMVAACLDSAVVHINI